MKILIIGVPRQSQKVIKSIEEKLMVPNNIQTEDVRVFLNHTENILVGRSKDHGFIDEREYRNYVAKFDTKIIENDPSGLPVPEIDPYHDNFTSILNLYAYLNLAWYAAECLVDDEVYIVTRPDLEFLDELKVRKTTAKLGLITLPAWQSWATGYNDRFFVARGDKAKKILRRKELLAKMIEKDETIKSERLMRYSSQKILKVFTSTRAQRLRNSSLVSVSEDFRTEYLKCVKRSIMDIIC